MFLNMSPPYSTQSTFFIDHQDIWTVLHPSDNRIYNLPLQVFSKIDYVLVFRTVLDRIKDCVVGIQTLSNQSLLL